VYNKCFDKKKSFSVSQTATEKSWEKISTLWSLTVLLSLFLLGHYQKEQSPKNFGLDLGNNDCQACILSSCNA